MTTRGWIATITAALVLLVGGCVPADVYEEDLPARFVVGQVRVLTELNGYSPDLPGWVFVVVPMSGTTAATLVSPEEWQLACVEACGESSYSTLREPDMTAMELIAGNEDAFPPWGETYRYALVFQSPYEQLRGATIITGGFEVEGGGPFVEHDLGLDPVPPMPAPSDNPSMPRVALGEAAQVGNWRITVEQVRVSGRIAGIIPMTETFTVVDLAIERIGEAPEDAWERPGDLYIVPEPGLLGSSDSIAGMAMGTIFVHSFFLHEGAGAVVFDEVLGPDPYLVVTSEDGRQTRFDLPVDEVPVVDVLAPADPLPVGDMPVSLPGGGDIRVAVADATVMEEGIMVELDFHNATGDSVAPGVMFHLVDGAGSATDDAGYHSPCEWPPPEVGAGASQTVCLWYRTVFPEDSLLLFRRSDDEPTPVWYDLGL